MGWEKYCLHLASHCLMPFFLSFPLLCSLLTPFFLLLSVKCSLKVSRSRPSWGLSQSWVPLVELCFPQSMTSVGFDLREDSRFVSWAAVLLPPLSCFLPEGTHGHNELC